MIVRLWLADVCFAVDFSCVLIIGVWWDFDLFVCCYLMFRLVGCLLIVLGCLIALLACVSTTL